MHAVKYKSGRPVSVVASYVQQWHLIQMGSLNPHSSHGFADDNNIKTTKVILICSFITAKHERIKNNKHKNSLRPTGEGLAQCAMYNSRWQQLSRDYRYT